MNNNRNLLGKQHKREIVVKGKNRDGENDGSKSGSDASINYRCIYAAFIIEQTPPR